LTDWNAAIMIAVKGIASVFLVLIILSLAVAAAGKVIARLAEKEKEKAAQ